MHRAITRDVSPSIARCVLTHLQRAPIDLERASLQHNQYVATLASLGVRIHNLLADPELPDAVFVEDTAVVFDEFAVVTRPGSESRRGETASIMEALTPYRKLLCVQPPGTLDGGDVLCLGKRVYVGLSTRTNQPAVEQLRAFLEPYGMSVHAVATAGCLHLKSAVTAVSADTLLINPAWVDRSCLADRGFIDVASDEPYAANALLIGNTVVYQPCFPRTLKRLEAAGIRTFLVDMSELGKAEGALTCCSLIFAEPS
jgi:dimethylargininase